MIFPLADYSYGANWSKILSLTEYLPIRVVDMWAWNCYGKLIINITILSIFSHLHTPTVRLQTLHLQFLLRLVVLSHKNMCGRLAYIYTVLYDFCSFIGTGVFSKTD